MKKLLLLMAAFCLTAAGAGAQDASEVKKKVTLEMSDGSTVSGWNHTEFVNTLKTIEVSQTANGARKQYGLDKVDLIVFDDGTTYVKKGVIMGYNKTQPDPGRWLRQDYTGKGITVYSARLEGTERVADKSKEISKRNYYLSMGDDPAVWVSSEYFKGGAENQDETNRAQIAYYFKKRYPKYAAFADRFRGREFSMKGNPVEIAKAWEEAYGGK